MATLTIYGDHKRTLDGMIKYIASNEEHNNAVLYYAAAGVDPFRAVRDMLNVKAYYNKLTGTEYVQIIVSLAEEENSYPDDILRFKQAVIAIADMMFNRYACQLAYAIHGNTDNLHAHYIINTVNYINGCKLQIRKQELYQLKIIISSILVEYGFSEILMYNQA